MLAVASGAATSRAWCPRRWTRPTRSRRSTREALPPRVRPARRLVEPRRQRHRGHHILGAAGTRGRDRPEAGRLPAAGHAPGLRRLRFVRARGDDRAHAGTGVHGFTLEPEIGALHPHPPEPHHPEDTQEFAVNASNQRFWEPPSSATSRSASPARPACAARTSTCADRVAGRRGAPHPDARRPVHVPKDTKDPGKPDACACCTRRTDGDADRAGGRRGVDRPGPHRRGRAVVAAPARSRDPRLKERSRPARALPRRIRSRRRRLHLPAVQRALAVRRRTLPN